VAQLIGPAREWGQKAQAEAYSEHSAHVCDAGGVKAQRLVESIRTLPSPKGGIRQRDDACGTETWHRGKGKSAAHAACFCVAQLGSGGRRRRRKRTENIAYMVVTLEVSKLSGWLKAAAPCRVQKGASDRGTTRVAHGDVAQREGRINSARGVRVCGQAREWGQKRRRWKRTQNMRLMSVTLEVSKLSGWLKADAYCRVQRDIRQREARVWHGEQMARRGRAQHSSARGVACVCGPARESGGRRRRRKRTLNILLKSVTLEVSKLSS